MTNLLFILSGIFLIFGTVVYLNAKAFNRSIFDTSKSVMGDIKNAIQTLLLVLLPMVGFCLVMWGILRLGRP